MIIPKDPLQQAIDNAFKDRPDTPTDEASEEPKLKPFKRHITPRPQPDKKGKKQ